MAARLCEYASKNSNEESYKLLADIAEDNVEGYCEAFARMLSYKDDGAMAILVFLFGAKEADVCRIVEFVQSLDEKKGMTCTFHLLAVGPHDNPAVEGAVTDLAMETVANPAVGPAPNTLADLADRHQSPVFYLPSHPRLIEKNGSSHSSPRSRS
jgi:hypothetical protein